jgi:hypothetical protein
MESVSEKSTAYVTVTFLDKDGVAAQPSSATYGIHDVDSDTAIRAAGTSLSPSNGAVEITLNKTDNTMVDSTKAKESRRVTVIAVYGADDELLSEYTYEVIGLKYITNPP